MALTRIVEAMERGASMKGHGYSSMNDVIEMAGQPLCVVVDVGDPSSRKKGKAFLAGMLTAAARGYLGVVMVRRPEEDMEKLRRAFGEKLLVGEGLESVGEWELIQGIVEWYPSLKYVEGGEEEEEEEEEVDGR